MNRRLLIIYVVVAFFGFVSLGLYQRRYEVEAAGGERILVITASRPIERGKIITEEMLSTREVPQAYVEDRAVKEAEKAKILGYPAANAIQERQTVMWSDVGTSGEDYHDLSSLVQPGSRGISVLINREMTSIALIRPGDYVDLITIIPNSELNPEWFGAVVLFQRVLVLATGVEVSAAAAADPKNASIIPQKETLLTLSLTTPEAQLLALATERGKLALALRNPDDLRTAERIPDIQSQILSDSDKLAQVKGRRGSTLQALYKPPGEAQPEGPAGSGDAVPSCAAACGNVTRLCGTGPGKEFAREFVRECNDLCYKTEQWSPARESCYMALQTCESVRACAKVR